MGMIRGALVLFLGIVLLVSLFAMNFFWTLGLSLSYDTVRPVVVDTYRQALVDQPSYNTDVVGEPYVETLSLCETVSGLEADIEREDAYYQEGWYVRSGGVYVPCFIVYESEEATLTYILGAQFDQGYYQEYDCEYFDCFQAFEGGGFQTGFMISQHAQDYWMQKFTYALLVSLALFGGMLVLSSKRKRLLIIGGFLLVLAALPYLKIDLVLVPLLSYFFRFFVDGGSGTLIEAVIPYILPLFFSQAQTVFMYTFIFACILASVGIVLHFWSVGWKVSGWLDRLKTKREAASAQEHKDRADKAEAELAETKAALAKVKKK